jgi:hypothetical protein
MQGSIRVCSEPVALDVVVDGTVPQDTIGEFNYYSYCSKLSGTALSTYFNM